MCNATHLAPGLVRAVQGFDQLRVVEVDEVRADANDRAVLIVELLHAAVVVTGPHEKETPQVGPSCPDAAARSALCHFGHFEPPRGRPHPHRAQYVFSVARSGKYTVRTGEKGAGIPSQRRPGVAERLPSEQCEKGNEDGPRCSRGPARRKCDLPPAHWLEAGQNPSQHRK